MKHLTEASPTEHINHAALALNTELSLEEKCLLMETFISLETEWQKKLYKHALIEVAKKKWPLSLWQQEVAHGKTEQSYRRWVIWKLVMSDAGKGANINPSEYT